MNYLAHIYLSDNSEENMLGNFLGDFVNKSLENSFEYSIKNGIFMHKKLAPKAGEKLGLVMPAFAVILRAENKR